LSTQVLVLMPTRRTVLMPSTCSTAFNLDYRVVVLLDCVASMYTVDLHILALENVARCLGWVLSNDAFRTRISAPVQRRARERQRPHPPSTPGARLAAEDAHRIAEAAAGRTIARLTAVCQARAGASPLPKKQSSRLRQDLGAEAHDVVAIDRARPPRCEAIGLGQVERLRHASLPSPEMRR
jgi:hypothetical protein